MKKEDKTQPIKCPNCYHRFYRMPKGFEPGQVYGSYRLSGHVKVKRTYRDRGYKLMQCHCVSCKAEKWLQIVNLKRQPFCKNCYAYSKEK